MKPWNQEFDVLRAAALACGLTEETKWGWPCFTLEGRNVVLVHGFKNYCALLFFKGALLEDPKKLLIRQSANSHASRQMRFTSLDEILALGLTLEAYIRDAVAVERSGRTIEPRKTEDYPVAPEFTAALSRDRALKKAFEALTPGRRRAYLLHFAGAKQSKTRHARIEKLAPRILEGKGMDD